MKVIANSLPKSGTHLLVRLLELLGLEEAHPALNGSMIRPSNRNPIRNALIWSKRCKCPAKRCLKIDLDSRKYGIKRRSLEKYFKEVPQNSFIAAHVPYSVSLDQYLTDQEFRHLYIIRDPRDVLVSYYDHQVRDKSYPFHEFFSKKTIDEAVPYILDGLNIGSIRLAPLSHRIIESRRWVNAPSTMSLKFETLIGPSGGGTTEDQWNDITSVLGFLGQELQDSKIKRISDSIFYPKAETFHKGIIGRWKTELNDESVELIHRSVGDIIEALGYDKS